MADTRRPKFTELGVSGEYDPNWGLKHDEFIPELSGIRALKKYREMRDNDPIIGAIITAIDMSIRSAQWKIEPPKGQEGYEEEIKFLNECFEDMEHSFEDFVSNALTFLTYGFSIFEIVYKRRAGNSVRRRSRQSKYNDGRIGIAKLAPRAQYTIDRFEVASSGEVLGVYQEASGYNKGKPASQFIPRYKILHMVTASVNDDPSGRSVLRNAYVPWYYIGHIQSLEAIAVERELNGLPLGRIPARYLSADATADEKAFLAAYKDALAKVRRNEVGYMIIPSEIHETDEGKPTSTRMVDFELVASKGTRDIDTNKVIGRHYQNIARSVLADFLMLGTSERGSFALSQDKSSMFLKAITGYVTSIANPINRELIPDLLAVNGFDVSKGTPRAVPEKIADIDLADFGTLLSSLVSFNPAIGKSQEILQHVLETLSMPTGKDLSPEDIEGPESTPPPAGEEIDDEE